MGVGEAGGRINKEILQICKTDPTSGVIATVAPDDGTVPGRRHLIGTITGPSGTPYENGVFDVDILIDGDYPFVPPKMRFITKIWHPNVSSQTGAICLVSFCYVYTENQLYLLADAIANVGCLSYIFNRTYLVWNNAHCTENTQHNQINKHNNQRTFWKISGHQRWL